MNLIVTAKDSRVSFETRIAFTDEERKLFLDSLAPWVRKCVTCLPPHFYADIPLTVINNHLPYGKNPVRFLWDILVEAHYQVTCPPAAY